MNFLLILLNAFFVTFTDKPEMVSPALSDRALEQREKWNIEIDSLDYPVSAAYIDSLHRAGATIYHTSRWMNGATVELCDSLADEVAKWDFVKAVEITRDGSKPKQSSNKRKMPIRSVEPAASFTDEQLELFNLKAVHAEGHKGEGILMAICDGGFYNADVLDCYRQEELELGHFDFTDDEDSFYGSTGSHGNYCLSTISGIKAGYTGAATKAQYYLMRSEEYATESPKEMDNLLAALEKADSLGVNIFSVSLGYAKFDNASWTLPKSALDGKSTRASRGATIAARKGMLVCVAAGNEGTDAWRTLGVPADADSVLTIGAVQSDSVIASFSSYGPSADGRIKPEVCAMGARTKLINGNNEIISGDGTSFATPLVAGMAAAIWSGLPDENAMQIRDRIIRSADRYDNPDMNQYGYGIPDAYKALHMYDGEGTNTKTKEVENEVKKVIRGEEILIMRHGHMYNLAGQRVN